MKLTRAGGVYIAITLLLGFAAVNTGNNLLYLMVSALLGFMAISGLLGQQNLQRLTVKVLPSDNLYANLPGQVEIELANRRSWLPAFLISVEIGAGKTLFPVIGAGHRERLALSLTLSTRGYQPLPPVWVLSRFPINFFIRSRRLQVSQQLLVFPQPKFASIPFGHGDSRNVRRYDVAEPGVDGDLRSIDAYQSSDPIKSIHWKLSARHEEYKVKRLHRLGAPSLLLDLDDFSGSLELRLSQCTFLINQLTRQQRPVGLRLGDRLLSPGTGRLQQLKLLSELACYDRH